jgi:hypothetical protein
MKIGDLVKNLTDPETGIGLVIQTDIQMWGMQHEPPGIKVLWHHPTWYDLDDGASVMYADELEIISDSR